MVEESLLTPELRALVGKTTGAATVRVTRRGVERAIDAYFGSARPRFEGKPGDPVPGVAIASLDPDLEPLEFPDVLPDALLISNEWEILRPLRLDEELTARMRFASITERFGGQFGYSIYVQRDLEFHDAAGQLAARTAQTMMHYDASSARKGEDE